jgi:hypothetical protein
MAHETKRERIVRSMLDNVAEQLHELKNLAANPGTKESAVETWTQALLKTGLGFSAVNGYSIRAQEAHGRARPDLIVYKGEQAVCVVEVKKLGFDLDRSSFRSGKLQLNQYLSTLGNVRWGILCNGFEWRLFDFSDQKNGGIEVLSTDLRSENEEIDLTKKAIEEACENLFDFHETNFANNAWTESAREATAFSPESLARAILSAEVTRLIARVIRGEHEYKANAEVIADRVHDLLTQGLDDAVSDWGELKQAELQKYLKAQKRANRKPRRQAKAAHPEAELTSVPADNTPSATLDPLKKAA